MSTPEAAALADAVDGLGAGLFLVDEGGQIIHANMSGHAMLDEGTVLCAAYGKLTACEANAAKPLKEIFAMAGRGDTAVGAKGTAVPLSTRDGEHYIAHVLPLTSGVRRRAGERYAAVAALFVHKAVLSVPFSPEAIARLYNLTPSELRVLLAIVDVGGVPETAQALGIAEATVKTHLHRLFCKTGAMRQADLVKLVAGFSNPLVRGSRARPVPGRSRSINGRGATFISTTPLNRDTNLSAPRSSVNERHQRTHPRWRAADAERRARPVPQEAG